MDLYSKPVPTTSETAGRLLSSRVIYARRAEIVTDDPVAIENMRERFPDIEYVATSGEAPSEAAAALVVTDWQK